MSTEAKNSDYPFIQRLVFLVALAAFGCAVDLWSKGYMFNWLGMPRSHNEWWIWEPYFGFETSINQGGLFGAFQGNYSGLAVISVIALLGIGYWVLGRHALRDLVLTVALGMIVGGILGNLYDRLGFWGHYGVRDWILFRYKGHTWPNFNVADSLLLCGAGLLLLHSFRAEAAEKRARRQTEETAAAG